MSFALSQSRSIARGLRSAVIRIHPSRQQSRGLHRGRKRSWLSTSSAAPSPSTPLLSPKNSCENAKRSAAAISNLFEEMGIERHHILFFVGNASYMTLVSGFLMTDLLSLRVALGAGYAGLVTFHSLHAKPLKIPLIWSGAFALINFGAACMIFADDIQLPGTQELSQEDEALYSNNFSLLKRGNFCRLMELGKREVTLEGTVLTQEGVPSDKLYFIESGSTTMTYRNGLRTVVDKGAFVNDVAFQQGEGAGAYGTVVMEGEAKVIVWDHAELRALLKSRPEMDRNVKVCLTEHLMYALMKQRDAAQIIQNEHSSAADMEEIEEETRHFVQRWKYDGAPQADAEAMWVI
uniref:Cyclic nucleotide-binding domain-containing protein n=1 Tax=Odontella aurita TaxID=265563 RepID=A0A7S4K1Z7_9STRA|mmetsp:Transcript_59117/g.175736  ORF Transcript_59117/g.175736 Transcript_59117/m.175736 type:complete len:349 (+) Transcript_59117:141-1187(+)